jgi:hypothetical protein
MVIISNISTYVKSAVHEDGNTESPNAVPSSYEVKKTISFTPYCRMKMPYKPNLFTILEENELQGNREGRNDLSTGLSRSKRSLHSGLSTLVLASEKLIEAASDCWASSSHTEIPNEDRSFSCGLRINGEEI